jgi:alpha-mannosidase
MYGNSGSMKKGGATGRPWFGQRDPEKVPAIIRTGTADVDFLKALQERERKDYPFDYYVVSWSLWDNCPLDGDLSAAVRDWNSKYAYPHITIAGSDEIMKMIETKYGSTLPRVKGDFTEYWTDGLGTAAGLISGNRNAKEKLIQAETLWSMLHPGKAAPRSEFDEAWRYIALGTEHTWCAENPTEPFFQDAIWKVKQSYFREGVDRTEDMLEKSLAPATDRSMGGLGPAEGPSNGGIVVFNTHSWPQGGLITLTRAESLKGDRVTDDEGRDVPSQRLSGGELAFLSSDVPPFGSKHYRVVPGKPVMNTGCSVSATRISSNKLSVLVNPETGNITELAIKGSARNFVDTKAAGGLNAFRWLPGDNDNAIPDSVVSITITEPGPLVAELKVVSKARGCRSVTRSVRLVYDQPYAEISNVVDKLPLVEKDGIHFGFGFDLPQAVTRMDIPWGIVRVEQDQLSMSNRNWLTVQRWMDISNGRDGITWCSPDAPLAEAGALTANQTGTWQGERKPWLRKLEPNGTIWSWVMNNHWFTNFPLTQDGPVKFRYMILPHGAYDPAVANRFGLEQAQPLIHLAADKNALASPLVSVEGPGSVTVTIVKSTAQDGNLILRLRSVSDRDETVKLTWPGNGPKKLSICDLEENPSSGVKDNITVPAMGMLTLKAEW